MGAFVSADIVWAILSPASRSAVQQWASTNVVNLQHDPLGSLAASAFVPPDFPTPGRSSLGWPCLARTRCWGTGGTVVVCGTGHVLATLASQGVVAYQIAHGLVPESDSRIVDVGPSYILVAAIAVAVLYGPWPARIVAGADFLILVVGGIFSGPSIVVSVVGHTTSIVVAAILSAHWRRSLLRPHRPPELIIDRAEPSALDRPPHD